MKSPIPSLKPISAALMMLLILGCATEPVVKMPESQPSSIKSYKHFTLWAGSPGMKRTGVYLSKMDVFTILATGSIDHCPRGGCDARDARPEHGWPLISRIGEGLSFPLLPMDYAGATRTAWDTGELHLGYRAGDLHPSGEPKRPEFYRDDTGSYGITIIIWAKDDYQPVADFLRQAYQKDPGNRAVNDALAQADRISRVQLATKEASQEIERTKKEIQDLKASPLPPPEEHETDEPPKLLGEAAVQMKSGTVSPSAPQDAGKEQDIAKLEAKLAKLTEQLTQLDTMKKEFEDQRKRSEALARELEQKEKTEQSLIMRLKDTSKVPPVIVIASLRKAAPWRSIASMCRVWRRTSRDWPGWRLTTTAGASWSEKRPLLPQEQREVPQHVSISGKAFALKSARTALPSALLMCKA
jgi:hypothetical protein